MGPGVFSVLRTNDNNWHGQPYGGMGLWWVPDDLAKIGHFLMRILGNRNAGVQRDRGGADA